MNVLASVPARVIRFKGHMADAAALLTCDYAGLFHREIDEKTMEDIRGAQLDPIRGSARRSGIANVINAAILVLSLWDTPSRVDALWWFVALVCCLVGFARPLGRKRPARVGGGATARSTRRAVSFGFVLGCVWGATPMLFYAGGSEQVRFVLLCICAGMIGGGAFSLASLPASAIAMIVPILAGSIFAVLRENGAGNAEPVALMLAYGYFLIRVIFDHARALLTRQVSRVDLERLARHDPLSDLPNLAAFRAQIDQAAARMRRGGERYSVIVLEIKHLGDINRRFGYAGGDVLIQQVAARLRQATRSVDKLARLDGDRFAVLALGLVGDATLSAYAHRVRSIFDAPFALPGGETRVTTSVGVAVAASETAAAGDLLRDATVATHIAEGLGAAGLHFYSPEDEMRSQARDALESDVREALRLGQLRLHFQPFICAVTNEVSGFEALLRWRHPLRGDVAPPDVVSIAEERGLIDVLSAYVLDAACRAAVKWPPNLRVAVNISPLQLQSRALAGTVAAALRDSGLPAARLEIEVTENALIADHALARHVLESLRATGVHLALDDFGVGFSSLNYLWNQPFERIKIDRSFINEMPENGKVVAIVGGILNLARDLGLEVTVEGVETQAQSRFFQSHAHVEAQGYLIGKAMPEQSVLDFLQARDGLVAAA